MLIQLFYTLSILLFLAGLAGVYLDSEERRFSLTLIQVLLGLPLLAGEYIYLAYHMEVQTLQAILFSEVIFAFIWLTMALRLRRATLATTRESCSNFPLEMLLGMMVTIVAGYFLTCRSGIELTDATPIFGVLSPVYLSSFFILLVVLYASWQLEQFWSGLDIAQRWQYKFMVVGNILICGTFAWSTSFRLTYLTLAPKHLLLSAALILLGWILMLYAVFHYQLLNRKIFVSRKIVYSFAVPFLLACYLLGFGLISLLMRAFGLEMNFILQWLLIVSGGVAAITFAFSGKVRSRTHFFISTHFYVNKYEYRDEWLALSQQLQGALSEEEVVKALRLVLAKSLYTTEIFIWLKDSSKGYGLVSSPESPWKRTKTNALAIDAPLIHFIQTHSHFYLKEKEPDSQWHKVKKSTDPLLNALNLRLIAPISVGNQLTGVIGLGPEYTGGRYGHDDFDLLTVLGTQTASALQAVLRAEEFAHAREQQAWNHLSAFVLHDIKNAATMLSMLQENAPEHIHESEFQQDMLELVDDTLRRMARVEQRLLTLKDEITPTLQEIELCSALQASCRQLQAKLPGMEIKVECTDIIQIDTDPELLFSILENLLLNAFQAQDQGNSVQVKIHKGADKYAHIEITDNGPGIVEEMLPEALFEPFTTNKKDGSGIGLWQVKRVVTSLGGHISADNSPEGGARFVVSLPSL